MTFRCEITTPVGVRVDPDVYCRYAGLERTYGTGSISLAVSRSKESTSTTRGAEWPSWPRAYPVTSSTTADVVRIATGEEPRRAEETRSSWLPACGTERGPARKTAC